MASCNSDEQCEESTRVNLSTVNNQPPIRVIEFFSGIGGWTYALNHLEMQMKSPELSKHNLHPEGFEPSRTVAQQILSLPP